MDLLASADHCGLGTSGNRQARKEMQYQLDYSDVLDDQKISTSHKSTPDTRIQSQGGTSFGFAHQENNSLSISARKIYVKSASSPYQ